MKSSQVDLLFPGNVFSCLFVSVLWGSTNPLIKKFTTKIDRGASGTSVDKLLNEIKYLLGNWKYLILFLINQSGSVLYYLTLQNGDLSLIVPVTNTLTLVFTGTVGIFLGEEKPDISKYQRSIQWECLSKYVQLIASGVCVLETLGGIGLILVGITLCILEKVKLDLPKKWHVLVSFTFVWLAKFLILSKITTCVCLKTNQVPFFLVEMLWKHKNDLLRREERNY